MVIYTVRYTRNGVTILRFTNNVIILRTNRVNLVFDEIILLEIWICSIFGPFKTECVTNSQARVFL